MEHTALLLARLSRALALCACALAAWPLHATAQTAGPWRVGASVYVYLPSLGGSTSIPVDSSGTPIHVNADQLLSNLKATFMGSLDAHNGRWGVFTDLIYLNLGDVEDRSRAFTIGNIGLPAGTTARLDWNLKGWLWTTAGQYRLVADPALTLDAMGGVRMFDLRQSLAWNISGNIGPIAPSGRSGSAELKRQLWDAIVGVKGRYAWAPGGPWSLPFHLDLGTGESRLTWQAAAGVTYAYSWGELTGMWRYLAYEMKPGGTVSELDFNGPLIGATWRW